MLTIAIVVAEPSGDLLAAGLMSALRKQIPDVQFQGVAGPKMLEQGFDCWEPMESLSVMGLVEVLKHLPRLLKLRKNLFQRWQQTPPDLFIGVDGPDFNLTLERKLKSINIPTVHYVCPTVWAWRQSRVKKIKAAVDLLLTIFPFETDFLKKFGVQSHYVGHPLAASMPIDVDQHAARTKYGIPVNAPVLAILPGSRMSEINSLSRPFLQSAATVQHTLPDLHIIVPFANDATATAFNVAQSQWGHDLPVTSVIDDTRGCLAAADVALVASGTATYEALLSKRPMVVAYKLHAFTHFLLFGLGMLKTKFVSMANLLADEELAPELIQDRCEAINIAPMLLMFFKDKKRVAAIQQRYTDIHKHLKTDTNEQAASAIVDLLKERNLA